MDVFTRVLSRRTVRTLYNVADALGTSRGLPLDFDIAPAFEKRLRHEGVGAARCLWCLLACIEWQPVFSFRSHRSFSRLDVHQRRSFLRSWENSRIGVCRRGVSLLRGFVEDALEETQSSGP